LDAIFEKTKKEEKGGRQTRREENENQHVIEMKNLKGASGRLQISLTNIT